MTNIRVTQAGIEIASEQAATIKVSQTGVELARSIDIINIKVSQVGIEVVYWFPFRIFAYDVEFEVSIPSNVIHPYGIAMETIVPNDVIHTSDVAME